MSFEQLVEQEGPSLLRLAYVLTGDRYSAEDLVQQTLAQVFRHWGRVRSADSPSAYVRRSLVNAHVSGHRRRRLREVLMPTAAARASSADPTSAVADRSEIRTWLETLAPRARTILVLRYYLDQDDNEIAHLLGLKPSTVRATASRALATVRDIATTGQDVTP